MQRKKTATFLSSPSQTDFWQDGAGGMKTDEEKDMSSTTYERNDINSQHCAVCVERTCSSIYAVLFCTVYSVHPSVECTRTPISKIKVLFVVVAVVEIIPRSSHSPVVDPTLKWGRARGSSSSSSIGAGRRGEGRRRRRYTGWLGSQWDLISEDVECVYL